MIRGILTQPNNLLADEEKGHWKRKEVDICIDIYTLDLIIGLLTAPLEDQKDTLKRYWPKN